MMRIPFRRHALLAALIGLAGCAAIALAEPAAASSATMSHRISASFAGSTARHVHYNIRVSGGPTVTRRPTAMSRPASNEKLLTTQTLLSEVGPTFRYSTTIYTTAPMSSHGVVDGDLVVRGGGDPTLTSGELALLAEDLHADGLRRVTGHLIIDDSRYNHSTRAPGWKHAFLPDQSGPIDAFAVDSDARSRSASYLKDPTATNARVLRAALHHHHVRVIGSDTAGRKPAGAQLILTHHSARLRSIVRETLTVSDNFNAEMMLREAGFQLTGKGTRTTGVAAIRAEAAQLGVHLGRVLDGSGLSYRDAESPRAITRWLQAIRRSTTARVMYTAVPTSCRTGTLEFRLCGAHVAGRVHAKTGTLDHVVALSGWTHDHTGRLVTFSFLLSDVRSLAAAEQHLDDAVSRLAR